MKEKCALEEGNDSEDDLWDYKPVKRVRKNAQTKKQNPKNFQLSTIIPHPKNKTLKKQGKSDKLPPTKKAKPAEKKTVTKPKESIKPPSQCVQSSSELFSSDHRAKARLVDKEAFPSEKEGESVVRPTKRLSDGLSKEGCSQQKQAKTELSQSSQSQKKIAKGQPRQSVQKKSKTPQRTPIEVKFCVKNTIILCIGDKIL